MAKCQNLDEESKGRVCMVLQMFFSLLILASDDDEYNS